MNARYAALFAFFLAVAVVHALVAFWTPIQGDDWNHWIWAGQYGDEGPGRWLLSHLTFSEAVGYLLARYRAVHVVLTPAVIIALVLGLFVLATRRWPRPTWDDLLGLALVSALIWTTQPNAGVTLFYTPNVALYVYGATVAVWLAVPFRCGFTVPRAVWPLFALAGYCAGTSTRAIGLAVLVGIALAIRATPRDRRARWMWIALGGVIVGVIVGYALPPWLEVPRVLRRGFEQNLLGQGLIRFALQETGELIALVGAFALVDLVLATLGRPRAPVDERPDPGDALRWLLAALATLVWCLFGPRYREATLLPVTCMLVIAALPFMLWFARSRWLRPAVVAFAIGVHAIAWPIALGKYHGFGEEGRARLAAFEAAPTGGVATVPPFSQVPASFWFFGEDLVTARLRELVAIEAFGLRDIVIEPAFRRMELTPQIEVALEVDGVTDAELQAAKVPAIWAVELSAARKQFSLLVKRLRAITRKPVSARLVVTNVAFAERGKRPLLAAWVDARESMIPRVARSPLNEKSQYVIRIYPPSWRAFDEAWLVEHGKTSSTTFRSGIVRVQPLTISLNVVVVCNPRRCLVAEAFYPRF